MLVLHHQRSIRIQRVSYITLLYLICLCKHTSFPRIEALDFHIQLFENEPVSTDY